jgi:hypothetical protein
MQALYRHNLLFEFGPYAPKVCLQIFTESRIINCSSEKSS